MIEHINKLFMAVIVLSLLTYFERSDYNLPLFAFVLLLWDNAYVRQKTRMWYLMAVSLLVDLIWMIYWGATWASFNNKEAGLTGFTIFISVIIFLVKMVIIVITFMKVDDCKRAVTDVVSNCKYVVKGPRNDGSGAYGPVE